MRASGEAANLPRATTGTPKAYGWKTLGSGIGKVASFSTKSSRPPQGELFKPISGGNPIRLQRIAAWRPWRVALLSRSLPKQGCRQCNQFGVGSPRPLRGDPKGFRG